MEEEKVRVKVHKVLLESEREELRAKRRRKFLISLLCVLFLIIGLGIGFAATSLLRGQSIAAFKTNKLDKISSYFNSVWLYKDNYEDLEGTMEDKAFYGMTNFEEDKYSSYMSKKEIEDFAANINKNYVGIGAQYSYVDNIGTITRVFKESPAEKGGLLPGDIILKVDGNTVENLTSDEIKDRITGEAGTKVDVTVLRSGKEVELTFIRNAIEYTAYAETINDLVYLNIMSFGESTIDECVKYLDPYSDYSKIIIDLRDNTGGYQGSVQGVAGLFLGKNVVVLNETDNTGKTISYETTVEKYYDNFKDIVVLVNENTASAAEVLSICLKEQHPNATLVGTTTYGKGVVQTSYYLEDGSAIKITTSDWTSPNGTSIHGVGVKPDVEVYLDDIMYETIYAMNEETYEYDSVSNFVRIAEMGLRFLGYDLDRTDGYFDNSFAEALSKYKIDNELTENEVLDKETYEAIISSVIRENSINEEKDLQLQKAIEILGD
ncbi:MAG: S41 family peptidase [Erysipelotrichaceae bacterium]|nr:S41 family peptidase [Erysipelotrichaceae bacterium]